MTSVDLYQSVLRKLANLPQGYLWDVDRYLSKLILERKPNDQSNVEQVMSYAGSWEDMPQEDFEDFLVETQKMRHHLFNREVDL